MQVRLYVCPTDGPGPDTDRFGINGNKNILKNTTADSNIIVDNIDTTQAII